MQALLQIAIRKHFFFEKKKQKTFAVLASALPDRLGRFFFSKKNCLLHLKGFTGIQKQGFC
jgi:hypothetical protein